MTNDQGPAAGDDAVEDGGGQDGVVSGAMAYEPGPAVRELRRRAERARGEAVAEAYPGLVDQVNANADGVARLEARLAGLDQLMRDTIAAAGLGSAAAEEKPRHLKLVRDTEAS